MSMYGVKGIAHRAWRMASTVARYITCSNAPGPSPSAKLKRNAYTLSIKSAT